jgi:multisubunit Na+/H+ antiporter MnhB subunit
MSLQAVRTGAATAYAVVVLAAVLAPSLVLDAATARGGAARAPGLDLVVASAVVGLPYAVFLQRSLRRPAPFVQAADRWLSAVHGLIALALTASVLPAVVLHETAVLHARVVDGEWVIVLGWAVLLVVSVALADVVRRASLRWLTAGHADGARTRRDRHVPPGHVGG